MRTFIALILTSAWFATAQAQPPMDCLNPRTQEANNACVGEAYRRSDAELNVVYKTVASRLKGNDKAAKQLVVAQRAWIVYRDAECAFVGSRSAGGSVHPMVVSSCLDEMTLARTKNLHVYLKCEEGDISCPTPPR